MSIWVLAFVLVSIYGLTIMAGRGLKEVSLPQLPPIFFLYFFLFFVVGYFLYATIYLVIGSVVTTAQEGGQLAMPVVMLLLSALYIAFPVISSPNSPFAVWVSMFPFFAPITMIVRIVSQTPPTWQIVLSLAIAATTAWLLLWLASRIYRVGMLMYGKKASIPEVWRWLRQAQ
jgi:ABC-2 type transport system permease protein